MNRNYLLKDVQVALCSLEFEVILKINLNKNFVLSNAVLNFGISLSSIGSRGRDLRLF